MSDVLLVTGGAGFIGSRIVAAARERGLRVRVLDSLRDDVHPASTPPPLPDDVEFIRGDVRDAEMCARALRGVRAVCHQAAKVGLGVDFADAPDYTASNVLGTAVLLAAMADAGVERLVLASSMVVYGEGRYRDALGPVAAAPRTIADLEAGMFEPRSPRTGEPLQPERIDESAPTDPRNVYAATKLAQEQLAASWARETGGRAALLRYHNVYGPGMPQGTPYAGVAALFRTEAEAGRPPLVFEDGGQRRDFVHVDDVAAANLAALDWTARDGTVPDTAVPEGAGRAGAMPDGTARDGTVPEGTVPGGTAPGTTAGQDAGAVRAFNVATGEVHTVGELAAAIAAARGGPPPVVTGRFRAGDVRHITASADRIHAELGWRARVGFSEGVGEFALAAMRPTVAGARAGARANGPAGAAAGAQVRGVVGARAEAQADRPTETAAGPSTRGVAGARNLAGAPADTGGLAGRYAATTSNRFPAEGRR